MSNDEKKLVMASLIANKLKENYYLDSKSATEEVIKDLREFYKEHGQLIDQAIDSSNKYSGKSN